MTSLFYKLRPGKVESGRPPLLLMMHGIGSNEEDLFELASYIPEKFTVVSVRGPLGFGAGGYAWFMTQLGGTIPRIDAEQADTSRKKIIRFLDELQNEIEFDEKAVYLLGFSQGGIMSYSVALTAPEKVKGIVVMSSRLLPEVKPQIAEKSSLKHLKIFISHGVQDQILRFGFAEEAAEYLLQSGLSPELHHYPAGHTITSEMLNDVVKWLEKL